MESSRELRPLLGQNGELDYDSDEFEADERPALSQYERLKEFMSGYFYFDPAVKLQDKVYQAFYSSMWGYYIYQFSYGISNQVLYWTPLNTKFNEPITKTFGVLMGMYGVFAMHKGGTTEMQVEKNKKEILLLKKDLTQANARLKDLELGFTHSTLSQVRRSPSNR